MKRGDIIAVALNGDYGKPRPALVVQSDFFDDTDSVLVCLITSTLRAAPMQRFDLAANETTGLRFASQVMVEKMIAVRRDKCGDVMGKADDLTMLTLGRLLMLMLGLAD